MTRALHFLPMVEAFLRRIDHVDPLIHSYITLVAEQARAAARQAEAEIMAGGWRGPLRIGVCRTEYWSHAEPGMREAMATAERLLRAAGAKVEAVELGPELAGLNDLKEIVMRVEGRVAFLDLERSKADLLSPGIVKRMHRAQQLGQAALRDALDGAAVARIASDELAGGYDALLTPAANGEAPLGLASTGDPIFTGMWTLLHAPCVTVPGLFGPAGLPIGLQLVAPRYRDAQLLAVAEIFGTLLASGGARR